MKNATSTALFAAVFRLSSGLLFLLAAPTPSMSAIDGGPVVLAPAYENPQYEPPPAGTYALPALGVAADGEVVASDGSAVRLHELLQDRIVLLSFIYTTCSDANGCPLATGVLYRIGEALAATPDVAKHLRLVSLSFDPVQDTPQAMQRYGAGLTGPGRDWRFVTTVSEVELRPILTAYGQTVMRDYDETGQPTGSFSHILRVFLIDRQKRIRNVYSVSFLHPELLINDVRTLLLEEVGPATHKVAAGGDVRVTAAVTGAGDYKDGYERADYETRSKSLVGDAGRAADLLSLAGDPPLGLPPVPIPEGNALTSEKIALGRKLFYDRRLSLNDTISCAMCHVPEQGFTSNELATAVGIEGRTVRRNAPTIYNVAYSRRLFHDGRETTLEHQVWGPFLAANEMANPSIGALLEKIRRIPEYDGRFEAAFGERKLTLETLGQALASYQRTLVSGNSPFDRWYYGNEQGVLSETAKRGFALFTGKAACSHCHSIGAETALFTDNRMHNTGMGFLDSMGPRSDTQKVTLAPGVVVEVPREIVRSVSEARPSDLGLYEVTQNPADRWKYRTPSLRNVALTAPYMHNGALATLREVVAFYNRGGEANEVLDPLIRPLGLTEIEIDDLVAFLQALTGDNVTLLVADAFAAPVGDLGESDPHWSHANRIDY